MVEHVFRSENDSHSLTSGIEDMCALMPKDWYGTLHEEIVRCRDCRWLHEDDALLVCDKWAANIAWVSGAKPDGFCSWGEHKEVKR